MFLTTERHDGDMDAREQMTWVARRAMFGLAPADLDRMTSRGIDAVLDELVAPDAHGVAVAPDPWNGLVFGSDSAPLRADGMALADRWFTHQTTTPRPLVEAMTWFWHDHFAVSLASVKSALAFSRYLTLLRTNALGDFRRLVTDITVDAAMLIFLDGATSSGVAPNENYGRELLELYTLGIGNYSEADVQAAARALTGWTVRRRDGYSTAFVRARHDGAVSTFLGRPVRDVATVVDAVLAQEACATFLAGKLAAWFLGPDHDPSLVAGFAKVFRDNDLAIAPLVRAILRAGVEGRGGELVLAPLPWLIAAQKALGVRLDVRVAYRLLQSAGQGPLTPPNVGGWPGPSAWLASSATVGRASLAAALVDLLPATSPVLAAGAGGDLVALAIALGRPTGFTPATRDALAAFAATRPAGRPGAAVAMVALASPDMAVA